MNRASKRRTTALACSAVMALGACTQMRPLQATPESNGVLAPTTRIPAQAPARAMQRPTEFIASSTPSWFTYSDRAGRDPATREASSERDFQSLKGTGLQRVALPVTLSADRFPVHIDDVLGETALQLECDGTGCESLSISVRSPDGWGTAVRLDTAHAFPVLWTKNPTMYKQSLELNIDQNSLRHPIRLKLSQWRFYLWAQ